MKTRKLLVIAVAGLALATPATAAWAQASNVQIYGRASLSLDNYQATGATAANADFKGRMRVTDSGSRFGVRGTEDLGGGLKAIFQIESGVNIDSGTGNGQSGAVNANTGFFASRDSYVGLEGGWGRATLGRQSYWWTNGVIIQTLANYANAEVPFFSGVALGRLVGPTARTSNTVQYTMPTIGGFNATLSYTPNSESAGAGANADGRIWGATARYSGIVNAQVDIAKNQAATPATGSRPESSGTKALVGWPYAPGAQIAFVAMRVKNTIGAAAAGTIAGPQAGFSANGDKLEQRVVGVSWEHLFGNIHALAQYGRLGKVSGCSIADACSNTQANAYMLGARYLLSKRTAVYTTFNKVTNESNQTADYVAGGLSSASSTSFLSGLSAGADPRIWALGMIHNF